MGSLGKHNFRVGLPPRKQRSDQLLLSVLSAEVEDAVDAVRSLAHCDTYAFSLKSVKSGTTNLGNFSSTITYPPLRVWNPVGLQFLPL